jgi:uncharacterized protein (DUF736 family)
MKLARRSAPAAHRREGRRLCSLQIDDPSFDHPIRANLFQSNDDKASWGLHWNRPPKRGERD